MKNINLEDNYTRGCDLKKIDPESESCMCCKSGKLQVHNWLEDIPQADKATDIMEVRFKNTRKAYFKNVNDLKLITGDIVAVEASPGHDIGVISLTGELVNLQLKKNGINPEEYEFKKIYRKAKQVDFDKWLEAINMEQQTMLRSRKISDQMGLNMKIGDVEYQGDKTKAIFYYIADDRVDFRELIKVLAEEFKVRIEMRQIGARQEAGRIGGIGPCGRELCCSTWMGNFNSVTTGAARYQELSLNPQKLAGQCGKLKCCLNYELDCYMDAMKDFPAKEINLELKDGTAFHQKTDVFRKIMWYSSDPVQAVNLTPVPVERVKEIIELNKKGQRADRLTIEKEPETKVDFLNVVGQESLTRFDESFKRGNKKKKHRKPHRKNENDNQNKSPK
ncbi:MAG: hypothetical protein A2W91_00405 [Bacteroidetes bacterium GWF2_38_335]|nr:MAG: hypothetical protein A2W91_00405 [Bacteroidetes bacterium GWF2_38_335]OFY78294.1 MAG: hypothetical protein A2281_03785 [Bacteroidetes bacterium RIFOXYA12_FULL_38_20]